MNAPIATKMEYEGRGDTTIDIVFRDDQGKVVNVQTVTRDCFIRLLMMGFDAGKLAKLIRSLES